MAWHPLSREEERALIIRCKSGDMAACNQLVLAFDRAVQGEVQRYFVTPAKRADMVQEGRKGILRALKKFDPDLGNRFLTYAHWWIRVYVHNEYYGKKNAVELLLVLDTPAGLEKDGESQLDCIEDPESGPEEMLGIESNYYLGKLRSLVKMLGEQDFFVIENRYLGDEVTTLEKVGQMFDPPVSRERVRQIELRALKRLRALAEKQDELEEYLLELRRFHQPVAEVIPLPPSGVHKALAAANISSVRESVNGKGTLELVQPDAPQKGWAVEPALTQKIRDRLVSAIAYLGGDKFAVAGTTLAKEAKRLPGVSDISFPQLLALIREDPRVKVEGEGVVYFRLTETDSTDTEKLNTAATGTDGAAADPDQLPSPLINEPEGRPGMRPLIKPTFPRKRQQCPRGSKLSLARVLEAMQALEAKEDVSHSSRQIAEEIKEKDGIEVSGAAVAQIISHSGRGQIDVIPVSPKCGNRLFKLFRGKESPSQPDAPGMPDTATSNEAQAPAVASDADVIVPETGENQTAIICVGTGPLSNPTTLAIATLQKQITQRAGLIERIGDLLRGVPPEERNAVLQAAMKLAGEV